ncbi:MAG: prolyl oligopeptidase family serine peptidase, partial [Planctomycetota bacterium]
MREHLQASVVRLLFATHFFCGTLIAPFLASAQGTKADYERTASMPEKWRQAWQADRARFRWTQDKLIVKSRPDGTDVTQIFDALTGEKLDSVGDGNPDAALEPQSEWRRSRGGGERVDLTFENTFEQTVRIFWVGFGGDLQPYGSIESGQSKTISTFGGHCWVLDFMADDLAGIFTAADFDCKAVINEDSRKKASQRPAQIDRRRRDRNGDKRLTLQVRDSNVWLMPSSDDDSKQDIQLTQEGTPEHYFERRFHYSPDRQFAIGFQTTEADTRRIPLVESSPDNQVQPKLRWLNYNKPGDKLSQKTPWIFDLENKLARRIDTSTFADAWSLRFQRWSPDGTLAYLLYNQRGHQQLTLRAIDPTTGEVTDIVHETSETFVDYSQKTMIRWLDNKQQLLWASERDRWNHLYRFDARSGKLINQVTAGNWVVRSIDHIDEQNEVIWFTALGVRPEEDPYHRHLARINFDGTGFQLITQGDGTHEWDWNGDRTLIVDRWSRVDQPEVGELRRASDGELVHTLWKRRTANLEQANYSTPIRFAAPGRDGKTMIYGYLVKPSNFDPSKRYPIIEDIYAGPHDHHVPKKFGLQSRERRIAELGFIVAKIDGMGTNWRSKAFHDVCWQNLADGGFPDRIAWLQAAAEKYPWLDLSRVGIFGGSAGGQNALAALLHHGDFYDVAVSDCGCHDNRMDKIWWNEAWMGVMGPHYADNSNVTHAHRLEGKLMLTVGELDNNVDPASTMQVVDALIKANKD